MNREPSTGRNFRKITYCTFAALLVVPFVLKLNGTILMPVPSSYNDITQQKNLRDHVGWVWYQRTFIVPRSWSHNRTLVLRFDSVHYFARVVQFDFLPSFCSFRD